MRIKKRQEVLGHNALSWDDYNRFHIKEYGCKITTFDTGEAIVLHHGRLGVEDMGVLGDTNAGFVTTNNLRLLTKHIPDGKLRDPDGTIITQTALKMDALNNGNSQTMWFDLDHRMAVCLLTRDTRPTHANAPDLFHRAQVYYAAPKAKPIGAPVRVTSQYTFERERLAAWDQTVDACKAWAALQGLEGSKYHYNGNFDKILKLTGAEERWKLTRDLQTAARLQDYIDVPFRDMTDLMRIKAAFGSVVVAREERKVRYITWNAT